MGTNSTSTAGNPNRSNTQTRPLGGGISDLYICVEMWRAIYSLETALEESGVPQPRPS